MLEAGVDVVPILRPLLPIVDRLLPYLHKINSSRLYTNHGPLVLDLERRLAEHLQLPAGGLISAASGTAAVIGAILATAGRATKDRPFALLPAFTFVGTASAVEACGYRLCLADFNADTWMLDPERVADHAELDSIGVVVCVAPFGRPVPQKPWRVFHERTKIPVVIDGAASFEGTADAPDLFFGDVPVALSFHATKSFATGEGGGVASTNLEVTRRAVEALNFGFYGSRDSRSASINGRMSEYHAAVGLAELDGWTAKRAALRAVADCYRTLMRQCGLLDRFFSTPDIGGCYALFQSADKKEAAHVQNSLRRHAVDFRLWYGEGLHQQSYFAGRLRGSLEVTDRIAPCLLGIPVAPDLTEATIKRVVAALVEGVQECD